MFDRRRFPHEIFSTNKADSQNDAQQAYLNANVTRALVVFIVNALVYIFLAVPFFWAGRYAEIRDYTEFLRKSNLKMTLEIFDSRRAEKNFDHFIYVQCYKALFPILMLRKFFFFFPMLYEQKHKILTYRVHIARVCTLRHSFSLLRGFVKIDTRVKTVKVMRNWRSKVKTERISRILCWNLE